tara:strand:- start:804 stop:1466 length:663 start_codon:yes stop_codon:yes gene_type:complete
LILTKLKSLSSEFCPIFYFDSLKPNKNFNHNRRFDEKKILKIERSCLSLFGFPQYGVHCNGWIKKGNSYIFYLAKRSKKIIKFPGLIDNFIAGGQPCGISIIDNLKKEGFEEAGLKNSDFKNLDKGNSIHYCHQTKFKINSAVIFVYDLELDKNIKPKNLDGEVEEFFLVDIENLHEILDKRKLKPNCIIPIADFFVRRLDGYFAKNGLRKIKSFLYDYD